MSDYYDFTVDGKPVTQGSKRHVGHGIMVESAKDLQPWRDAVSWHARRCRPPEWKTEGAFSVTLSFYFARPVSLPRKVVRHVKRPDVDKLARAALDAMTGIVYRDDAQIDRLLLVKRYGSPGVIVDVWRAEATETMPPTLLDDETVDFPGGR